jgi:Carbohydrate esterase, sialic acid-specific acetylesterase
MISRRRLLATGAAFTSTLAAPNVLRANGPVAHIVLAIGQSNMTSAFTEGQTFPGGWIDDPAIQIWNENAQSVQTYQPGANSSAVGTYWGPEAEYARQRRIARPSDHLCICKVIGVRFFPRPDAAPDSELDWFPYSTTKRRWAHLIDQATYTKEVLTSLRFTPRYDVILVFGGESDANENPAWATQFRYYFSLFLDSLRIGLNAPEMRTIITRIFPAWDPGNRVRNAQIDIGSRPGNAWIDIDDVAKADAGHASPDGTKEVGSRMWMADSAIIP